MSKACLWLACSLVLLAWPPRCASEALIGEAGPDDGGEEDSLRPAIEVLNRRQRDLAGRQPYGNYPGVLRYHYEPSRRNVEQDLRPDNLEFLSAVEDEGVGQPEDIGYGYQRGFGGGIPAGGREELLREQQAAVGARVLENLLKEYLERGREAEEENDGMEDAEKRSPFRERGGAMKRGWYGNGGRFVGPPLVNSPFRERMIQEGEEDGGEGEEEGEGDERRKRLLAVIKRLEEEAEDEEGGGEEEEGREEEEEEDEKRRKRIRVGEEDNDVQGQNKMAVYLDLLENLWDKYEAQKMRSPGGEEGCRDCDEEKEARKRARGGTKKYQDGGPTFDHFNSPVGWMGGGGGFDSFGRRRRSGGRMKNPFTVLAPSGREAPRVWFSDPEGPEADHRKRENEPDAFRFRDERWGEEEGPEEWGPAAEEGLLVPARQRRFPVAKRSFQRSIPALEGEKRKRRESGKEIKTDPKVVQALSQIFEGSEDGKKSNETKDRKREEEEKKKKRGDEVTPAKDGGAKEGEGEKEEEKKKKRDGEREVAGEREEVKKSKTEVKKSIDWSDYFGMDRRRKKSGGDVGKEEKKSGDEEGDKETKKDGEDEKLDDWLLNQYYKTLAMSTNIVKRGSGGPPKARRPHPEEGGGEEGAEEGGLDAMDSKLRRVEDAIVEEAIKDTGAHNGGSRSVAEGVRERVLSRLAAAYSLEKMRKALGEFKESLREDQEENGVSGGPKALSIAMVAKERTGGRDEGGPAAEEERERRAGRGGDGAFMGPPLEPSQPMSEGYMGGRGAAEANEVSGGECPALERLATNCQGIGDLAGDYQHLFLDLCNWHEVCYICGAATSSNGISSCDLTFLREVDSLCHGHEGCRQSGRRMAVALRAMRGRGGKPLHQHQSKSASLCWQHPCLADYLARRRRR